MSCVDKSDAALFEIDGDVGICGQDAVDVHVFPFALTATALAAEGGHTWLDFWRNLKDGYDRFEAEGVPPRVAACRGQYRFGADAEGDECVVIAAWS